MGELFAEFDVWGAFWLTIKLSVWSAVWALLLGTVLAIMRVGPVRILNVVGAAYVNIVRNTPLTLVVLFSLTVLGTRLGIQIANDESPTFLVDEAVRWAIFALSVYHAAFVCEALRSGVNTVPVGQAEAARSIGLGFGQSLRLVVLPQAFRAIVPKSRTFASVLHRATSQYTRHMAEELSWDEDSAAYIRSRGERYPNGMDIDPEWTEEVMADVDLLALEPDPKSRMGASRFIGHSPSAGRVLVVIAHRDRDGDLHGINAWPATGMDLKLYTEGIDDGQDD